MEKVWESGRRMSRSISRGMGMENWGVDDVFLPQHGGSRSRAGSRSGRGGVDDDEEALRWAAIERLPTYNRVRTAILSSSTEAADADDNSSEPLRGSHHQQQQQFKAVDVRKLGVGERQEFIERVFRVAEEDNQRFLQKLRNRLDRYAPTLTARPAASCFFFSLSLFAYSYNYSGESIIHACIGFHSRVDTFFS